MIVADDFGLGRLHDKVILDLLERRQIDGTSVMIDGDMAQEDVDCLRSLRQHGARIGLHLNLTQPLAPAGICYPLGTLIRMGLLGRMPAAACQELQRQAQSFRDLFGSLPDYYDGHQHCHILPGLAPAAAQLPRSEATWMRLPMPATLHGLALNLRAGGPKVGLIALFCLLARRHFRSAGWSTNKDFSGFLRLEQPDRVKTWLPRMLQSSSAAQLIMVHPGSALDPAQCAGHHPESRATEARLLQSRARPSPVDPVSPPS